MNSLPFVPCLPDRSGKLRLPSDIKVPPDWKKRPGYIALWDSWVPPDRHMAPPVSLGTGISGHAYSEGSESQASIH